MDRADLIAVSEAAGVPPTDTPVEFVGPDDPIYPSPLRLGHGTAAVLANIAGAIDDIAAANGAPRQTARIDVRHALVSISSMWVLRVNGVLATEALMDAVGAGQGIFRTRDDRWLYLLSGFPHIVERTLEAIGCADVERLEEHIAARDAADLEAALNDANLTGVIVRSADEWRSHPQGALLADAPAVMIEKMGDDAPTPLPQGELPLSGLRVIDATRVLAGPTISRTLAALGADVLHVGAPGLPDIQAAQADTGHGKRRAFIDLNDEEGPEALWELIDHADVFVQSYRAGSLARRGFFPGSLAAERDGIIYVSENAYGQDGPWSEKRGFDGNVQAASGIHALHQPPGQLIGPGPAMAMNDYCTGYWGAYGVLEALKRRAVEGGAWHVTVSLGQTAAWFLRMGAPHQMSAVDPEIGYQIAEQFSENVDSDYGQLTRLKFPIELSHTRPRWSRTVKPGTHPAEWLPR